MDPGPAAAETKADEAQPAAPAPAPASDAPAPAAEPQTPAEASAFTAPAALTTRAAPAPAPPAPPEKPEAVVASLRSQMGGTARDANLCAQLGPRRRESLAYPVYFDGESSTRVEAQPFAFASRNFVEIRPNT